MAQMRARAHLPPCGLVVYMVGRSRGRASTRWTWHCPSLAPCSSETWGAASSGPLQPPPHRVAAAAAVTARQLVGHVVSQALLLHLKVRRGSMRGCVLRLRWELGGLSRGGGGGQTRGPLPGGLAGQPRREQRQGRSGGVCLDIRETHDGAAWARVTPYE